ncbi:hypothetical protein NDU88_010915 [Pleurodeles waltl]|uniref:Uncharacterized protein n=1 Tax=Pleurodeles waltl TaxID=8319 RepID=A0AAV7S0B8_PLEWA|nr:hypothetical protein NDU88_010915 [Pleurodeles waltl]
MLRSQHSEIPAIALRAHVGRAPDGQQASYTACGSDTKLGEDIKLYTEMLPACSEASFDLWIPFWNARSWRKKPEAGASSQTCINDHKMVINQTLVLIQPKVE